MFVVVFGLTLAPPFMLIPLVTLESLGLCRYGSIAGLTALALTLQCRTRQAESSTVTSSYAAAFEFFIVIDAIGALGSYACLPLAAEQVRLTTRTAASARSLGSRA